MLFAGRSIVDLSGCRFRRQLQACAQSSADQRRSQRRRHKLIHHVGWLSRELCGPTPRDEVDLSDAEGATDTLALNHHIDGCREQRSNVVTREITPALGLFDEQSQLLECKRAAVGVNPVVIEPG